MSKVGGSINTNCDYNKYYLDRMEYMVGDAILSN